MSKFHRPQAKFLTKKIDEIEEDGEKLIQNNGSTIDQKLVEEGANITKKTERKMYENLKNLNTRFSRLRFICIVLVFFVLLSNIFIAAFDNFINTEKSTTLIGNENCTTLLYNWIASKQYSRSDCIVCNAILKTKMFLVCIRSFLKKYFVTHKKPVIINAIHIYLYEVEIAFEHNNVFEIIQLGVVVVQSDDFTTGFSMIKSIYWYHSCEKEMILTEI